MDGSNMPAGLARVRSPWRLECSVAVGAVLLIAVSIGMFLLNSTSDTVAALVNTQNDAAKKLRENLDYYEHHRPKTDPADTVLPPGLFDSIIEFSRTNVNIMKSVHRLSMFSIFTRKSLKEVQDQLKPTDGHPVPEGQPYFSHLGVDPRTNAAQITEQGMYQIELFQAIRDYSQDESDFYKKTLGAFSVYLMPVFYALLGAALWAVRSASRRPGAGIDDPLVNRTETVPHDLPPTSANDRSSRFVMAAIAGIAISGLGTLLPSDVLVSPLAIAFVCGYAIEVFTFYLDGYIAKLMK